MSMPSVATSHRRNDKRRVNVNVQQCQCLASQRRTVATTNDAATTQRRNDATTQRRNEVNVNVNVNVNAKATVKLRKCNT